MKPRTIIPLVIGLGVGFFAIKMGIDMVQKAKGAQGPDGGVVVGVKKLDVAVRIHDAMVRVKRLPAPLIPKDAITDPKQLVGRVTGMTIPPDMAITESMLAPPGSEPGLRAIVPPGKRAVSVTVDEAACVAGFVRRGCRVDVSAVDKHGVSRLILSDVEVAAIGQSMSEPSADGKTTQIAKTVTLFVDPEQVQMVHAYTSDRSKIKLALRGDHKDKRGASLWSDLLARAAAPRPAPPRANPEPAAPREHVMNIVRGTEVQRIVYTEAGGNVSRPGPAKNPRPAPAPSGGSACPSSPAKTPSVAESNE